MSVVNRYITMRSIHQRETSKIYYENGKLLGVSIKYPSGDLSLLYHIDGEKSIIDNGTQKKYNIMPDSVFENGLKEFTENKMKEEIEDLKSVFSPQFFTRSTVEHSNSFKSLYKIAKHQSKLFLNEIEVIKFVKEPLNAIPNVDILLMLDKTFTYVDKILNIKKEKRTEIIKDIEAFEINIQSIQAQKNKLQNIKNKDENKINKKMEQLNKTHEQSLQHIEKLKQQLKECDMNEDDKIEYGNLKDWYHYINMDSNEACQKISSITNSIKDIVNHLNKQFENYFKTKPKQINSFITQKNKIEDLNLCQQYILMIHALNTKDIIALQNHTLDIINMTLKELIKAIIDHNAHLRKILKNIKNDILLFFERRTDQKIVEEIIQPIYDTIITGMNNTDNTLQNTELTINTVDVD